jgi:uncharacterized protein (TIGR03067 family)
MKRFLAMVAAIGIVGGAFDLFAVADAPPDDETKKEYARFEGTWQFVSVEVDGKKVPEEAYKDSRLVLKGNKFVAMEGKETHRGTFKVDVSKKPRHLDITFTDGPHKGDTLLGIYELKGDIYKVCLSMKQKDRPRQFASQPDSGHILEVLKRQK